MIGELVVGWELAMTKLGGKIVKKKRYKLKFLAILVSNTKVNVLTAKKKSCCSWESTFVANTV